MRTTDAFGNTETNSVFFINIHLYMYQAIFLNPKAENYSLEFVKMSIVIWKLTSELLIYLEKI